MICEFCGSTLDDNELECPYCGHRTNVEPQVYTSDYDYEEPEVPEVEFESEPEEYYDSEESYAQDDDASDDEYEVEKPVKAKGIKGIKLPSFPVKASSSKSSSVTKSIGDMPKLILMGACAVLSLICLVSVLSMKNKIDSLEQTMLSQFYQLQSANNDLSNALSGLNGQISNVSTTISEANDSKNITITKNPSSESTYLGRGSDSDVSQNSPLFTAEATGAIQTVEWQVKENGEWVTISWDASSNNLTYGLHIYNDIGPTTAKSQLCSHDITSTAFNKSYRCVFTDSFGMKATEVVILTERAK